MRPLHSSDRRVMRYRAYHGQKFFVREHVGVRLRLARLLCSCVALVETTDLSFRRLDTAIFAVTRIPSSSTARRFAILAACAVLRWRR